jgi:hypothetical protein
MADIEAARKALIERLLGGDGRAPKDLRRAAFDLRGLPAALSDLLEKVARRATAVQSEDFALARAAFTEDQIFEAVVCAAVGEANRRYEAAMAALDPGAE